MNTSTIRETARGIILRDGQILLIRRTRQNAMGTLDNWLSIPGGGLELDETPEQAILRELQEELGVTVTIQGFLATQEVPPDACRHNYFLCSIVTGEPRIREQSEEYTRMQHTILNTYEVEWVDLKSPKLPHELFWSYAEAYTLLLPLIRTIIDREPLKLLTTGGSLHPRTVILNR